jgi:hypothetical protein
LRASAPPFRAGGEGPRGRAARPERALDRVVLLLDVLADDTQPGRRRRNREVRA